MWWEEKDLHITTKTGEHFAFMDARITDIKQEFNKDSGVEMEELPLAFEVPCDEEEESPDTEPQPTEFEEPEE
jgi:hypothetical protein